ncbi:MAG: preprotein translocase subunit SecE [Oscillospiraceae bacterium]|nr:preprotein translocase subunit SecE [Oscillospiraceae bacterium]
MADKAEKKSAAETKPKKSKADKADKTAKNQPNKVVKYFKDLRSEFKKVVWPSRNTVVANTGVVIGSMIITGIGVFAMDYVFALMFEKLMGLMK